MPITPNASFTMILGYDVLQQKDSPYSSNGWFDIRYGFAVGF
jgi:hypothetical protein